MNRILLKRLALGFAIASPLAFAISCSSPEKTVTEPDQTPENPGGNNPGGNKPDTETQNPGYLPTTPSIEYIALKKYIDKITITQRNYHTMTIVKFNSVVSETYDLAYFKWWDASSLSAPNALQVNITGHSGGAYSSNPHLYYMLEKSSVSTPGQKQSFLLHLKGQTRNDEVTYYRDPITLFSLDII